MADTGERERVAKALAEVAALREGLAGGAVDEMPVETLRTALLRALDDLQQAYERQLALLEVVHQAEAGIDRATALLDAAEAGAPSTPRE